VNTRLVALILVIALVLTAAATVISILISG
jgi:hypothetical protein